MMKAMIPSTVHFPDRPEIQKVWTILLKESLDGKFLYHGSEVVAEYIVDV